VPENGLVMSLWFNHTVYESASRLDAQISIKNVSKEPRLVWTLMDRQGGYYDITFTIKDSTGKELVELPYQQTKRRIMEKKEGRPLCTILSTLAPGDSVGEYDYDIGKRFDLSGGGTFTIRAQRKVRKKDDSGDDILVSNEEVVIVAANSRMFIEDKRRWGAYVDALAMSLFFKTNVFESAAAIVADIEIKNTARTYNSLNLWSVSGIEIYFRMKDSTGKELVELPYQTELRNVRHSPQAIGHKDAFLYPGGRYFAPFYDDIGKRFDLSRGGTFTIRAQREVPKLDGAGDIVLESNEETITIGAERKEGK
jgi:hypothetical protein